MIWGPRQMAVEHTRSFTARTTTDNASGDAIASFLLGIPSAGRLAIVPQLAVQSLYFGAYAQDAWKLSRRLTLSLGVRWDSDGPTTERYNRLTNFATQAPFPAAPT